MLLQFDTGDLDESQREWITKIHEGALAMSGLIDAMKQLQDLETGQYTVSPSPVDLDSLVKGVVTEHETIYGGLVSFQLQGALPDGTVQADQELLTGVFKNLVKNAVEHVIELPDDAQRAIDITLSGEDGQAVVSIRNGGEPIPPERLETFFEKFNSTKESTGGAGLGTTYAYLATRAHGGSISVASNAGDGTTVTVKLPQS
jgi:two-component system sensor histidine kinase SenX3